MGGYDTLTVIALVDLVHDGQSYKAGAVLTVPARTAVTWLMQRHAMAAPKGTTPTPTAAPSPPTPEPPTVRPPSPWEARPSTKPKTAPKKAAGERTYQRRDLEPEE